MRIDGRSRFESRDDPRDRHLGNAEGSARVQMGNTIVAESSSAHDALPRPTDARRADVQRRGQASRGRRWRQARAESIELGRVVDRGIRESAASTSMSCA